MENAINLFVYEFCLVIDYNIVFLCKLTISLVVTLVSNIGRVIRVTKMLLYYVNVLYIIFLKIVTFIFFYFYLRISTYILVFTYFSMSMYNDIDFHKAVSAIAEQVVMISDPQLAITVEKWLTKLTSTKSGANELHYLKLLRIMVDNRQICRPFLDAPPGGPLISLSRYINPSLGDDRCTAVGKIRVPRMDETDDTGVEENTEGEGENVNSNDAENSDKKNKNGRNKKKLKSEKKYTNSENINNRNIDKETYRNNDNIVWGNNDVLVAADGPRVNNNNEKSYETPKKGNTKKNDVVGAAGPVRMEKQLYLAAGGGEESDSYWALDEEQSEDADDERNILKRFCNPCVDCLGRHLKKYRHKSTDEAYWDFLEEDCAIPALTDVELMSVDPELVRVLKDVDYTTTLQEFCYQVCGTTYNNIINNIYNTGSY